MTANPLVLQMKQIEKQLETTDLTLKFNRQKAQMNEGPSGMEDQHVQALQSERDQLQAELARLKAQLEWQQQQGNTSSSAGAAASAGASMSRPAGASPYGQYPTSTSTDAEGGHPMSPMQSTTELVRQPSAGAGGLPDSSASMVQLQFGQAQQKKKTNF